MVSRVEVTNPPITTVARGRCTSAPAEDERAIAVRVYPRNASLVVEVKDRGRGIPVPINIL